MPKFFRFIFILLNSTDRAIFDSIYHAARRCRRYMKKKILIAASAALVLAGLGGYRFFCSGMDAAEVVRKLSALRLALALYKVEHKKIPSAFEEVLTSGKLESVPELKLRRHFSSAKVRNVSALEIRDTGGWAYVNAPGNKDFGLVYIDSSHADEKGRFWSEF